MSDKLKGIFRILLGCESSTSSNNIYFNYYLENHASRILEDYFVNTILGILLFLNVETFDCRQD